ncbi:hypothetical protein KP509_39G036700 [Ceratopteris richardii]|uniref:Exocyst subunit Exo70 family protein n=1 Tax=Ceratopteris richardii TaxID=49495 RepID=A0A8T2PZS7_CERRI|nr:hypothetical protein KP509_39G036700 [Ceratopteris richardii]
MPRSPWALPMHQAGGVGDGYVLMETIEELSQSLKEGLELNQHITHSMVSILSSFDQRLSPSFAPSPQMQTQNIANAQENIEKTLQITRLIVSHYDFCHQAENKLAKDPAKDFKNYISYIDKLQETMLFFKNNPWLKDSEGTLCSAENALKGAMEKLAIFFRHILTENSTILAPSQLLKMLSNISSESQKSQSHEMTQNVILRSHTISGNSSEEVCDAKMNNFTLPMLILPASCFYLHEVAKRMTSCGYDKECLDIYRDVRSAILEHMLEKLGIQRLHKGCINDTSADSADLMVSDWLKLMQASVQVLFAGEHTLCDKIFEGVDPYRSICLISVIERSMNTLLDFAETFLSRAHTPGNLFHFLNMYSIMHDLLPEVQSMLKGTQCAKLFHRYSNIFHMLNQTSLKIFWTLDQEVCKVEAAKTFSQDCHIHPVTNHAFAYVKALSSSQYVLEKLITIESPEYDHSQSALSTKMSQILTSLISKLEARSRFYKDHALAHVFLINNVHFLILSIQRCNIQHLLGEWLQKHQSMIQQHIRGYLHASWDKALNFLDVHEVMSENSQSMQTPLTWSVLKERLKMFNSTFDKVFQKQAHWGVHDAQMRKTLQKAVMESILPTYSFFFNKSSQALERHQHPKKYIKYSPVEVEKLIEQLFEDKTC